MNSMAERFGPMLASSFVFAALTWASRLKSIPGGWPRRVGRAREHNKWCPSRTDPPWDHVLDFGTSDFMVQRRRQVSDAGLAAAMTPMSSAVGPKQRFFCPRHCTTLVEVRITSRVGVEPEPEGCAREYLRGVVEALESSTCTPDYRAIPDRQVVLDLRPVQQSPSSTHEGSRRGGTGS